MVEGCSLIKSLIQPWKPWCAEPDWLPFLVLHAMYSVIKDTAVSTYEKKCIINLPPQECHLLSGSIKMESLATSGIDLQHPERSSGQSPGMRHSLLWETRLLDTCRINFYEPNLLHLIILRKVLKWLTKVSVPLTSSNCLPRCFWRLFCLSEIMYMLTVCWPSPGLFRAIPQSCLGGFLLGYSPKSPNKTENHSCHTGHFNFSWQKITNIWYARGFPIAVC